MHYHTIYSMGSTGRKTTVMDRYYDEDTNENISLDIDYDNEMTILKNIFYGFVLPTSIGRLDLINVKNFDPNMSMAELVAITSEMIDTTRNDVGMELALASIFNAQWTKQLANMLIKYKNDALKCEKREKCLKNEIDRLIREIKILKGDVDDLINASTKINANVDVAPFDILPAIAQVNIIMGWYYYEHPYNPEMPIDSICYSAVVEFLHNTFPYEITDDGQMISNEAYNALLYELMKKKGFGMVWRCVGTKRPETGMRLVNPDLEKEMTRLSFIKNPIFHVSEWKKFNIKELYVSDYVEVYFENATLYYMPVQLTNRVVCTHHERHPWNCHQ